MQAKSDDALEHAKEKSAGNLAFARTGLGLVRSLTGCVYLPTCSYERLHSVPREGEGGERDRKKYLEFEHWLASATRQNLKVGFLDTSIASRTTTIYGSGNEPFNTANLFTIALATVRTLQRPNDTANKHLFIRPFTATQNVLLAEPRPPHGRSGTSTRRR
jgi:hypothetical protein